MNIGMNGICRSVVFLGLCVSPWALAVERPADLDEKPHQLKDEGTISKPAIEPLAEKEAAAWQADERIAVVEAIPGQKAQIEQGERIAEGGVPYLGVGSTPIDELLSGHLGIEHGVVIQQVHQGSGASKAGLLKNDILTTFDGRAIRTPLDLRDAVRNCQVGDEVAVNVIRKGQKKEEVVLLEQRPAGLPGFVPRGQRGVGQLRQLWPDLGDMPDGAQEQIDRLRNLMDEEFNGIGLGLKLNEMLEGDMPDGDGQIDIGMNAESSVTWSDGKGTITMKMKDGQTEVQVRDNNGALVYDGPWETPQDKAAVDPEVHDRIENMGVRKHGNQLKFWMEGLPGGR